MTFVDARGNIRVASGKTLTYNGTITGTNELDIGLTTAAAGLNGTLVLGGTNTGFSGLVRLLNDSAGTGSTTLRLTNATALGTAPIWTTGSNGSVLQLNVTGSTNFGNNITNSGLADFTIQAADATGSLVNTGFTHTLGTLLINNNTVTVNGGHCLTFGDVTLANNG